jgi:hypothetical protein
MSNFHNLTANSKRVRLKVDGTNYQRSAGQATDTSEAIDTRGYSSVLIREGLGAITATGTVAFKVQQSSDDASTDTYDDIAGTAQALTAAADAQKVIECEIHRPAKRYLKVITTRAVANGAVDFLEVFLYNPRNSAPAADTTVAGSGPETFNTPAEGTA